MLRLTWQKSHIATLIITLFLTSSALSQSKISSELAQHNYFLIPNSSNPLLNTHDRFGEMDDIREAVFRYQFKHIGSGWVKVYFLSFGRDKSPSDKFMKRFKGHKPSVKKESQSIFKDGLKDKETGETVDTCALVTTKANGLMEQIHNSKKRMPTILTSELAGEWISDRSRRTRCPASR